MAIDQTIPLDTPTFASAQDNLAIPVDDGTTSKVDVSPEVLRERAAKFDFALAENSPGLVKLETEFNAGNEERIRQSVAFENDNKLRQARFDIVDGLARSAAEQGRELSAAERQTILDLTDPELNQIRTDPETFIEKQYAQKVYDKANEIGDPTFDKVAQIDPEFAFATEEAFVNVLARKEAFQKLAEEENKRSQDQSWLGWGVDMATSMIPGVMWYNLNKALKGHEGTSILPGNNLAEQIDYLHTLPPEEGIKLAREAITELRGFNQLIAQQFANALVSYTSSSQLIDNLFIGGVDIATFGTAGAVRGARAFANNAEALGARTKAVLQYTNGRLAKAASKPGVHPAEVADAMGDVDTATALTVLERVNDRLTQVPTGAKAGFEDLMNQIHGFVNPLEIVGGVRSSLSAEATRRIVDRLAGYTNEALQQIFVNPTAAGRLPLESLRVAMQEQKEIFRNLYRLPEDAILRVTTTEPGETGVDAIYAKIHFGDNAGNLFDDEDNAFNFATEILGLRPDLIRTMPEGNKWYVEVVRPLDETSTNVRAALRIDREGATDLGNTMGKVLASIRSGSYTLPKDIAESLVNSVVGGSKLAKLLQDMTKDFLPLGKNKKDFLDFLDAQRRFHDGVDAVRVGKYNETLGEFEADWRSQFGRLPTEQEAQAYFTYKRLNDIHYAAMNVSRWTDKIRTGHAEYKIDGITIPLEGKIVVDGTIPGATPSDIAQIMVINPSRYEAPRRISNYGSDKLDQLRQDIKNKNLVVVQLSPWGRQQAKNLDELSDLGIIGGPDFIVMPRHYVTERQLSMTQSPFRPGGHIIYDEQSNLIVQPRAYRIAGEDGGAGVLKYYGDHAIMVANKNVEHADLAKRFDNARVMLRDLRAKKAAGQRDAKGWSDLRKFVQSNLPITYRQFLHDYTKKGNLDLDLPIIYSPMNKSSDETFNIPDLIAPGENIQYARDSDSAYNTYAGQVNLKYAQEKGLLLGEAQNIGSKEVPMYGLRSTTLIDPMAALERSMQSIVRGRSYESAKWEAAEKFVAEFGGPGGVLKQADAQSYGDPVMAMLHGEFRPDADPDLLRAATIYRKRMEQFFGTYRTPDQKMFGYAVEKLLAKLDTDAARYFGYNAHDILSIKNPVDQFKAIAFHSVMGFMNIKQALLNANTSTHIIGIAGPVNGGRAVAAAMVHSIAMHGGKNLDGAAGRMMEKLGFSKEEYLEAIDAMRRSGWDHVGRETATRQQHMNAQIMATTAGKVLDAGLIPFTKSDEFIRVAAWNAAFLEFKQRNPGKKLNDAFIRSIVARADDLSVNMTQASNSALQEGSAAFATQFWSYQMRMTEQFMGKRLSTAEKMRLFGTYSAVYGLPIGVSGVVGIWPVHDSIRKYYLENGRDIEETKVEKFVNDGVLSLVTEMMVGEKTNINQVMGPNGIPFLYQMLFEDTTLLEAMTGASGSTVAKYAEDILPVFPWMFSLLNPYAPTIQPKMEDFWDVVGNINSLGNAEKAYYALNYGQLFDKYGQTIDPSFEGIKGFMYSLSGTLPDRVEDYYAMYSLDVVERRVKTKQEKMIKEDLKKALNAESVDEEMSYIRRAQTRGQGAGFEPRETNKIMLEALRENKSAIEKRFLDYQGRSMEDKIFLQKKYQGYRIKE